MERTLAAFIMTYERAKTLEDTIDRILEQTVPPEKILIVDNSAGFETKELIENLGNPVLEYFRVGYNAGPAGAAKIGLERLASEGFSWIYWGDDDDPPRTHDAFQTLLEIPIENKGEVGILGLMGNNFNVHTALITKLKLDEMRGIREVNSMAGGSMMLVNGMVVKRGIVPDEQLFFGYEELDFCLRVRKAGYRILVDADYYRAAKINSTKRSGNRLDRLGINIGRNSLWRQYYSTRNLLIIVCEKERSGFGLISILLRTLFKMGISYFKGIKFGRDYSVLMIRAFVDFARGRKGRFTV